MTPMRSVAQCMLRSQIFDIVQVHLSQIIDIAEVFAGNLLSF